MINVCYLVDAAFLGGAERYVSLIATHLDRSRFRPSVVMRTPDDPGSPLIGWGDRLETNGVPVRSLPMNLPFAPFHAIGIFKAVHEFAPHVVHVNMPGPHDGQMGLLVPLARMSGATGVVVTEHLPMVERLWKRALLKRFSYRWVDRVITVCRANVPYLTDHQFVPPKKAGVIPNALRREFGTGDTDPGPQVRETHGLPAEAVLVVFVGNLLKHKGLHRLIRALSGMPELPWHLAVVGEGPERGPCEALLEKSSLGHRATFTGRLTGAGVEAILRSADVLALPSETEGMPYVILEAMAAGLPVVASSVYGIPELVDDGRTGLLVPPDDSDGLQRALRELLQNGPLRNEMGRRARERFEEHFTLDKQVSAIEALYLEIAGANAERDRGTR